MTKKRILLSVDQYPELPDYDAHVPVVEVVDRYITTTLVPMIGAQYLPDLKALEDATREDVERYLSKNVGPCRKLEARGDYYAVATPEWLEMIGSTREVWETHIADRAEFEDLCAGECYVAELQELVTWHADGHEDRTQWETVESMFGLYGMEDAELTAHDYYGDDVEVVWEWEA